LAIPLKEREKVRMFIKMTCKFLRQIAKCSRRLRKPSKVISPTNHMGRITLKFRNHLVKELPQSVLVKLNLQVL
jgi:hypothetical protein